MKSLTSGLCIAFAALNLGGLGCGAAEPDEAVGKVREALSISSWSSLVGMASSGTYVLTADIDAAGRTWTPKTFSGSLDGNGFTISNVTINNGSFFSRLTNASVQRIAFTNLRLTGTSLMVGGLAGVATNTTIRRVAVEADIDVSATAVGGLVGSMTGGIIRTSYAKGTIDGNILYSGGLVGIADEGEAQATIMESYAQVTVNPVTTNPFVVAGGIVGSADAGIIHDVYAVGDVTGRESVGGIAGSLWCSALDSSYQLFKTIYRGDVKDLNRSPSTGGWAGPVGRVRPCSVRVGMNYWDKSLDRSTNWDTSVDGTGYTTTELQSPTTVTGGVFCGADPLNPTRCGDLTWSSPPWTPGTSSQHHVLTNMPGPNAQPR